MRRLLQDVLHILLGDGAGTLRGPAVLAVAHQRPHDALEVDAVVLIEARVLDRDDGLLHHVGDLRRVLDHDAILWPVELGDLTARVVEQDGALGQLGFGQIGRQVVEVVGDALGGQPGTAHRGEQQGGQHERGGHAHGGKQQQAQAQVPVAAGAAGAPGTAEGGAGHDQRVGRKSISGAGWPLCSASLVTRDHSEMSRSALSTAVSCRNPDRYTDRSRKWDTMGDDARRPET